MHSDEQPLVLVTDDNAQARALLCRLLEREGFRVAEAANGSEALHKACDLLPDLVLMDIQMPVMNGFEALRALREEPRTARIPIIVVTAAARDTVDVTRGFGLGADDYIVKPFNSSELIARARSKIKARQLEDTLHRRNAQLEILTRIGSQLVRALALPELSDYLLNALCSHLKADSAILMLLNAEGKPDFWRVCGKTPQHTATLVQTWIPIYLSESGRAALVDDTRQLMPELSALLEADGIRSGVAVPLMYQERFIGVLALASCNVRQFSGDDLRLLETVASQAALAIHNAQLYCALQEYAHNLEATVQARTEALKKAEQQLMRADRLAALGTLAAGIAHEINNPLQPLLTNLELMLEDVDQGRSADREMIEFAIRDVQRIRRIVSNLLDFARPARSALALLQINDIAQEVLTLARKQLEQAHIQVELSLRARQQCKGNADQLKQVLLNLVINAMEAMPNGGELSVATADVLHGGQPHIKLTISDTGVGIPPERLDQIFNPFFSTKPNGTGLGLAISHSIITAHGGQIQVESQPSRTSFIIFLPAAESET
ncbi:MAG: response regulator [Anaerolineae bacterium]|nr:response regulator [Anaerolineae bacterium]